MGINSSVRTSTPSAHSVSHTPSFMCRDTSSHSPRLYSYKYQPVVPSERATFMGCRCLVSLISNIGSPRAGSMYGQFIRPTDRTPGSDSSFVTSWITSPRVGVTGSIAEVIILLFSYMDKRSLSISSSICQLFEK